jgi:TPR repeat protein
MFLSIVAVTSDAVPPAAASSTSEAETFAVKLGRLRAAAAQGDAEASYQIYEHHKSWDRRSDRTPGIPRAEAEAALRRAAELAHPQAMFTLALLLDRGTTVRRDAVAARLWAARAAENPPPDVPRGTVLVMLGRLLSASETPEERVRGREWLAQLAAQRAAFNAQTEWANALRSDDPVRARRLLEANLRSDPGGATPPLADMLIKGEGGPADPARALTLLRATNEIGALHGALGRLYLEGRLVPRDVPKAIALIRHEGVWNVEARLQVMQLLADHPDVRIDGPEVLLYDGREAAELGEPGALAAALALLLSEHPQFRDRKAACELARLARERNEALSERAKEACPAP